MIGFMAFSLLHRFRKYRADAVAEFYQHIRPLLEHPQVQEMGNYIQHNCYTRLNHCIDVAYFSFFIAKLLRWDSKSAARGGLLHDLFLYDRKIDKEEAHHHLRRHPITALENARKVCTLNKVEENIIRRHMWLITLVPPRYKEGYIVTFVDKYCAVREAIIGQRNRRALALAEGAAA